MVNVNCWCLPVIPINEAQLMKKILVGLFVYQAISAQAGGMESLENFVRTVHSGHAEFTQVVTPLPKSGQAGQPSQAAHSRTSIGTFDFVRPDRFRFVYKKPLAQTIVADGQTLWLYDVDLNQVTARKQAAVLATTPAALISAAPDIKALQADFALAAAPDSEGLEWVTATPKNKDSSLRSIRLGFRKQALAVLDILDSFGQRSVMSFGALQENGPIDASLFQFKPPAGADVIRQ